MGNCDLSCIVAALPQGMLSGGHVRPLPQYANMAPVFRTSGFEAEALEVCRHEDSRCHQYTLLAQAGTAVHAADRISGTLCDKRMKTHDVECHRLS